MAHVNCNVMYIRCHCNDSHVLSGEDMMWIGEQPVNYKNWEDSSTQSDLAAMDTCAALHTSTGKWEIVSCLDDVENGVVCETSQSESFSFLKFLILAGSILLQLIKLMDLCVCGVTLSH